MPFRVTPPGTALSKDTPTYGPMPRQTIQHTCINHHPSAPWRSPCSLHVSLTILCNRFYQSGRTPTATLCLCENRASTWSNQQTIRAECPAAIFDRKPKLVGGGPGGPEAKCAALTTEHWLFAHPVGVAWEGEHHRPHGTHGRPPPTRRRCYRRLDLRSVTAGARQCPAATAVPLQPPCLNDQLASTKKYDNPFSHSENGACDFQAIPSEPYLSQVSTDHADFVCGRHLACSISSQVIIPGVNSTSASPPVRVRRSANAATSW